MHLGPHIDALTSFAETHLSGNEDTDKQIRLKLKHSLKVLENAEAIIEGENISGHGANLCRLAALYHDIGRFPQFARYRTFNDRESVNHARLGVLTLRDFNTPGNMPEKDWRTVRFAIAQHNLKQIKHTLPTRMDQVAKLVRDADKLDIFRVMVEHFNGENPDPVVTYGFDDIPGYYSLQIYDSVINEEIGDYSLIECSNDFKLLIIGWLYGFHYQSSRTILAQSGHLNEIFSLLPKDNKIQALKSKVNNSIRYNSD